MHVPYALYTAMYTGPLKKFLVLKKKGNVNNGFLFFCFVFDFFLIIFEDALYTNVYLRPKNCARRTRDHIYISY